MDQLRKELLKKDKSYRILEPSECTPIEFHLCFSARCWTIIIVVFFCLFFFLFFFFVFWLFFS